MKSTEKEENERVIRKRPSEEEERANFRKKMKEIQGETSEPAIAKPSSRQKSSLFSEEDPELWFYNFESIESLLGTTQIEEDRTREETEEKRDRKTFATEKYENEDVRKERLFFSDIFLKIAKQKEVTKKDKEAIGHIMRDEGWIFCKNRSCKLFTDLIKYLDQLYPRVYEEPVAMAITEACLFTLGIMPYHILDRHEVFQETFIRYIYGDFSEEIKLAAVIANDLWGRQNTNTEDALMFLLQIIKTFDSVNKQYNKDKDGGHYMGYEWSEITECFDDLQKDYTMKICRSFDSRDAKYLSDILRTICDIGRIEHHFYSNGVNELAKETIKIFMSKFKQRIMNTFKQEIMRIFKQKESFDSTERDVINCFCNSLNIVGQICLNELSNKDINYICETIFICLNELEEFIKTNIYAVRIVEVLLYCLCNVVKCEIRKHKYLKKNADIERLWRFYRDCSASESVKLAAAVSFVSLCQMNESQRGRNNLEEVKNYLKNIVDEMRERQTEEYRGFSLQEIEIVAEYSSRDLRTFFFEFVNKIRETKEVKNDDKMLLRHLLDLPRNKKREHLEAFFIVIKECMAKQDSQVQEDPVSIVIIEACLFTLAIIWERVEGIKNYQLLKDLFRKYFYGDFSEEIKLAVVVANRTRYKSCIKEEDVLMFLFQIFKYNFCENKEKIDVKKEDFYKGFKWKKIIKCLRMTLEKYTGDIDRPFEYHKSKCLCDIIRAVLEIGQIGDCEYTKSLLHLAKTIFDIFKDKFKQKIMRKFKQKESFDSTERDVINCFCNSLNIVAQICLNELSNEDINYICETIFICLNELEEFIKTNIYAVRIVEVVLYCLCNVVNCAIKEDNYLKKKDEMEENEGILRRFYRDCSTSESVKLAAAVSFVSLCQMNDCQRGRNNLEEVQNYLKNIFDYISGRQTEDKSRKNNLEEVRNYLKNIVDEMRERQTEDYRGFSLQEVRKVIRDSTGGTE